MKRLHKFCFLLAALTALFLLLTVSVYAVPAAPHSGKTGAEAACRSHTGALLTLDDIHSTVGRAGAKKAPSLEPATKNIPLAIIVIGFSNRPYNNNYDWATTIFEGEKSLEAYYTDMSFGKFTFTPAAETSAFGKDGNTNLGDAVNDGVIHVNLSVPHKDWSTTPLLPSQNAAVQKSMLSAFSTAVYAAGDYIDFSAYDADGDGVIAKNELAIGFVVAGYEGSYTEDYRYGRSNYLWAHAWSVTEANDELHLGLTPPVSHGVTVDAYIAVAEDTDDGQEPISVLVHELGHYLGLMDLYETNYNTGGAWGSYDVGLLSVMSAGSWGVDPDGGYIPHSMDAWCRYILGWYTPETADADGDYTVTAQSYSKNDAFSALIVPTQHVGEYYLIENRQSTKWDVGLPEAFPGTTLQNGLLLWHIDDNAYDLYSGINGINNSDHRPTVMPLYPEGNAGSFTFTGKSRLVNRDRPFFDSAVWQSDFSYLGDALDLPLYGEGTNVDKRDARTLSGVKVRFLTPSAASMTVNVNVSGHNHKLSLVLEKAAGCTEPGRRSFWSCNICGGMYADEAGTVPVTEEALVLPALGHTNPNVNGRCDRCGEKLVSSDEGEGDCPYCGENHDSSFLGKFIRFFHRIFYFFRKLFRIA